MNSTFWAALKMVHVPCIKTLDCVFSVPWNHLRHRKYACAIRNKVRYDVIRCFIDFYHEAEKLFHSFYYPCHTTQKISDFHPYNHKNRRYPAEAVLVSNPA